MNPIHIKKKNKGKLHEDLGLAKGTPIPMKMLNMAKKSKNPAERKRATFAKNARTWSDK